jgi:hypothetical protein
MNKADQHIENIEPIFFHNGEERTMTQIVQVVPLMLSFLDAIMDSGVEPENLGDVICATYINLN